MSCLIWQTPATIDPPRGDETVVISPRAGGRYSVTGSASGIIGELSEEKKLVLTTWLCDQRRLGVTTPSIDTNSLKEIVARAPLTFSQRVERTLLFLAANTKRIDDRLQLASGEAPQRLIAESANVCRKPRTRRLHSRPAKAGTKIPLTFFCDSGRNLQRSLGLDF